jgi:hypothetical protein
MTTGAAPTTFATATPEWLALREPADARARSRALADEAVRRMPAGPAVIHDLGSGTGAMMRWLAPVLAPVLTADPHTPGPHTPGPQAWVRHDGDAALLALADVPPTVTETLTSVERLADLRPVDLARATLVTASALLDVLTRDELAVIVAACRAVRAPALFSLSVTGRVDLDPSDPADRAIEAAFNDHQRRQVDGRLLLGPSATAVAQALFEASGWRVRTADTPWILDARQPRQRRLIAEWLDGWVGAALEQGPALEDVAAEYLRRRRARLARGDLRVVVHHKDLLAWPE